MMGMEKNLAIIDTVEVQQVQSIMEKITQFQQVVQRTLRPGHDYGIVPGVERPSKPTLLKPGAEKILMMLGLRSEFEIVDSTRDFEKGFFQYQVRCKLLKGDTLITEGLGSCNTKEKKYSKMDPYTMDNTVLKMAKKRALIDATLLVASLSDVFTQDAEDLDADELRIDTQKSYTDQDDTISKAQAKKIFAIAEGNVELVRKALKECGYEKLEQVKKREYDTVCSRIKALLASGGREPGEGGK